MDNGKSTRHHRRTIMAPDFNDYLNQQLAAIDDAGLRRELRKVDSGRQGTISQEDFEKLQFKIEDIL